jgi:hypothetical protein
LFVVQKAHHFQAVDVGFAHFHPKIPSILKQLNARVNQLKKRYTDDGNISVIEVKSQFDEFDTSLHLG